MSASFTIKDEKSVTENQESKPLDQSPANDSDAAEQNSDSSESRVVAESGAGLAADVANSVKGFCMGMCDAVPGVSGGTVALIVGIYERLFIAISHIDRRLFLMLRKREWGQAARHVDARFLATLIIGLGLGYVVMSLAIKVLMADAILRSLTLAAFGGMVIGSIVIVFSRLEIGSKGRLVCAICGIGGCALSVLIAVQNTAATTGEVNLLYLFVCTVVAICAMILPGISGAMLLLIFGVYYYVLEIPRNLIHLENVGTNLVNLLVVLAGCVFGLLTFGRVVKWLLSEFKSATLSTMIGLMMGSLVVLWPFQNRIEPTIEHHKPTYEIYMPSELSGQIFAVFACVIFFAAAVIAIDRIATRITKAKLAQIETQTA